MKTLLLLLVCCVVCRFASAQPNGENGNERPDDTRLYDPATVETIRGEVTSVEEMPPGKDMQRGVHIQVATGKEKIVIHLGPPRFLVEQDLQIREGDQIEVTGSRVMMSGEPAIIARRIKDKNKVSVLRNESGVPMWSRAGRGHLEPQSDEDRRLRIPSPLKGN